MIRYKVELSNGVWSDWYQNGAQVGVVGSGLPITDLRIKILNVSYPHSWHTKYRIYTTGWSAWKNDDEIFNNSTTIKGIEVLVLC